MSSKRMHILLQIVILSLCPSRHTHYACLMHAKQYIRMFGFSDHHKEGVWYCSSNYSWKNSPKISVVRGGSDSAVLGMQMSPASLAPFAGYAQTIRKTVATDALYIVSYWKRFSRGHRGPLDMKVCSKNPKITIYAVNTLPTHTATEITLFVQWMGPGPSNLKHQVKHNKWYHTYTCVFLSLCLIMKPPQLPPAVVMQTSMASDIH